MTVNDALNNASETNKWNSNAEGKLLHCGKLKLRMLPHPSSSDRCREYSPSDKGGVLNTTNPLLLVSFWLNDPLTTGSFPFISGFILMRIFVAKRPIPLRTPLQPIPQRG